MAGNSSAIVKWLILGFSSLLSVGAADTIANEQQKEWRVSLGKLNGELGEYVYDPDGSFAGIPGYKLSQLNWQINSVSVLGIGLTLHMDEQVRVNFDYWKNVAEGDGTMDDYDWLYPGLDWSDWSHHENTPVKEVSRLDFNGEFQLFHSAALIKSLNGVVGLRRDHFAWESIGGYGIYSVNAYRDTPVVFPDVPGISYQQTFTAPYFGLNLQSASDIGVPVRLTLGLRYSPLVRGEDVDIHHLRSLRFETDARNGTWYGVDVKADFAIDDRLSLNLSYFNQHYSEMKGGMMVTDLVTGGQAFYGGDSAGLDHSSSMFSLGIRSDF